MDPRTSLAARRRSDAKRQRARKARYRKDRRPMPAQVYRAITISMAATLHAGAIDPRRPSHVMGARLALRALVIRAVAVLVSWGYPASTSLAEINRRLLEEGWRGIPSADPAEPTLGALGRLKDDGLARFDT